MKAGGRDHVVEYIAAGDPCLAVPQPDNPHDANAIAVHTAPASALRHPIVSSVRDAIDHVGLIHDEDRALLMDRQAGFVPAKVAARLDLPPEGIVGWVGTVRYHPDTGQPAGFDMVAAWPPMRRTRDAKPSAYDPDARARRARVRGFDPYDGGYGY